MIETNPQSLVHLPKRNRGHYLSKMRKNTLITNLYKVDFDQNSTIHIHVLTINPDLAQDSTQRLNAIVQSARKSLEPYIGSNFALCGRTVYSCHMNSGAGKKKEVIEVEAR